MYTEIDLLVYLITGATFGLLAGAGVGAAVAWRLWLRKVERLEIL